MTDVSWNVIAVGERNNDLYYSALFQADICYFYMSLIDMQNR